MVLLPSLKTIKKKLVVCMPEQKPQVDCLLFVITIVFGASETSQQCEFYAVNGI
jgi:hypothetical protein